MSKEDWIIMRLLFALLRCNNKPDLWMNDVHKSIVHLMKKDEGRSFFAALSALEQEKGLKP